MVKMKKHPTLGIMVRSDGMVLNTSKKDRTKQEWTYGNLHHTGYRRIMIKGKLYLVHRLIAETFLENIENKPQVDHIDHDKSNNDVSNLRWVTNTENQYNKNINRAIGLRKCDLTAREYNTILRREQRAKKKLQEAKCV